MKIKFYEIHVKMHYKVSITQKINLDSNKISHMPWTFLQSAEIWSTCTFFLFKKIIKLIQHFFTVSVNVSSSDFIHYTNLTT